MTSQNIVFFGTPEFAVPTLEKLGHSAYSVRMVVTQPDRPKGRGRIMTPPPVKTTAKQLGCDILQPTTIRESSFLDRLAALDPHIFVVVAFGRLLPPDLLSLPELGTVNVHASLLPKYRGAAPIQWAIINGEESTGVTTMMLDSGMDTGEVLLQKSTTIRSDDTAATLHNRLSEMGADLLMETLEGLNSGTIHPRSQEHAQASYAPMLKKSDGRIDWTLSAGKIDAFIRGMNPWPGAFTFLGKKRLKIYSAVPLSSEMEAKPGTVVRGFAGELRIATGDGVIRPTEIQSQSGKRLPTEKFLQGCPIPPGTVLS